ncbi:linoleoyl-CoA desaturase [Burkholderia ubonensis]|uniref:fatty acid desaturase family protein n=1 Tax=Burkholderia ubonensis TaxID=101571 RepID=UPI000753AA67|nr:fatty acid desaturase [Burkholderia ubonensis]KVR33375.1 linoleoyl-CoA desaturase [Burkholderia ubonensis]
MDPRPAPHVWPEGTPPFDAELRVASAAYLRGTGDHRYADARQWLKGAVLLSAALGAGGVALTAGGPARFALGYVAFVLLFAVLAINFMHDAVHGTLIGPPRVSPAAGRRLNAWIARAVTVPLGIEPAYWRVRHIAFHHPYANIEGRDLDLEENFFLCQTPFQTRRPHHRYQHLYWPLIAALSMPYIGWIYDWSDRLGKTPVARHRALPGVRGWLTFVGAKLAHFALMLALPVWALHGTGVGWGGVIAAYVFAQMCASCFVVGLLLGTHWADVAFYRAPDCEPLPHGWREHGLHTAVDWLPEPRWLAFWLGGLHRHATHHLFPTWHHRHCDALAALAAPIAARHGVPYRVLTYRELIAAQRRFLKQMGGATGTESE